MTVRYSTLPSGLDVVSTKKDSRRALYARILYSLRDAKVSSMIPSPIEKLPRSLRTETLPSRQTIG